MKAIMERFLNKVKVGALEACWEWEGYKTSKGYGRFSFCGAPAKAHRIAYELFVGVIPIDQEIHHFCNNKGCVNPRHLQLVSRRGHLQMTGQHRLGGLIRGQQQSAKTYCPQGHPYDLLNTIFHPKAGRQCRICKRALEKERRKRSGYQQHFNK